MSIYVYITRKPIPFEEGPDISVAEWHALALAQPDFRLPTAEEQRDQWARDADILWTGGGADPWWFSLVDGQVEVKGATESSVMRMHELAKALQARVVTETGEIFDEFGRHAGFEEWSDFN